MATDERNFRSSYYEKVGCRGVEEKKSLEILLKERPWDRVKLRQFCLRFTLPAAYRALVWKVLLGVLPHYADSHAFVAEQRAAQHADLMHALSAMGLAEGEEPPQRLLAMWRLEGGARPGPPTGTDPTYSVEESFVAIAEVMLRLHPDGEVDAYWLAKGLMMQAPPPKELPPLIDLVATVLQKEDPTLAAHLVATGTIPTLSLPQWFGRCFAGVLDDSSLLKIWDKVVGGAYKILAFVAVMVLRVARRALLEAHDPAAALLCLEQRPEECEEVIAMKAIELWHCYGALPQAPAPIALPQPPPQTVPMQLTAQGVLSQLPVQVAVDALPKK